MDSVEKLKKTDEGQALSSLFDDLCLKYQKRWNIERALPGLLLQWIDKLAKARDAENEARRRYEAVLATYQASHDATVAKIQKTESETLDKKGVVGDPKSPLDSYILNTLLEIRDQLSMCDSMVRSSLPVDSVSGAETFSVR